MARLHGQQRVVPGGTVVPDTLPFTQGSCTLRLGFRLACHCEGSSHDPRWAVRNFQGLVSSLMRNSELPMEIIILGRIWSFTSNPADRASSVRAGLRAMLPERAAALAFCDNFFLYASWL